MRDRHVLETVLLRRFPGAGHEQVAAAANAIMALIDQWASEDQPRSSQPAGNGDIHREERHERTYGH